MHAPSGCQNSLRPLGSAHTASSKLAQSTEYFVKGLGLGTLTGYVAGSSFTHAAGSCAGLAPAKMKRERQCRLFRVGRVNRPFAGRHSPLDRGQSGAVPATVIRITSRFSTDGFPLRLPSRSPSGLRTREGHASGPVPACCLYISKLVRKARRPACVRDTASGPCRMAVHCQHPPGVEVCGVPRSGPRMRVDVPSVSVRPLSHPSSRPNLTSEGRAFDCLWLLCTCLRCVGALLCAGGPSPSWPSAWPFWPDCSSVPPRPRFPIPCPRTRPSPPGARPSRP